MEEKLCLAPEEGCQLKRDVEAKSLKLTIAEDDVDVKSKALANLEVVPTLSLDDMTDFKRHKHVILDMLSFTQP